MRVKTSENYLSNRAWLRSVVNGEDVILRKVSALEFLELFVGYVNEAEIDVYAKKRGIYEGVNYHIVDTFEGIEHKRHGDVLCSTVHQAVNDMLAEYESADEQALAEALSKYYYSHNKTFMGLRINQEYMKQFELIKEQAIMYYCEESL